MQLLRCNRAETVIRMATPVLLFVLILTVRAIPKVKVELIVPVPLMTWL